MGGQQRLARLNTVLYTHMFFNVVEFDATFISWIL